MAAAQVRIEGADKDAVLRQVKSKNYQVACQRHFEATHKGHEATGIITDGVGNHPNGWMHASMEFHKAKVCNLDTVHCVLFVGGGGSVFFATPVRRWPFNVHNVIPPAWWKCLGIGWDGKQKKL